MNEARTVHEKRRPFRCLREGRRGGSFHIRAVEQLVEELIEGRGLVLGETSASCHRARDGQCLFPERHPLLRHRHEQHALILRRAAARQQALGLERLQHGREGAGIQVELLAERLDGDLLHLPDDHHRDILRVGQAERLKVRTVLLDDLPRAGVEREADLAAQEQRCIVLFRHIRTLPAGSHRPHAPGARAGPRRRWGGARRCCP